MTRLRLATANQVRAGARAITYLRLARAALSFADAPRTLDRVRHTLKSAEGAQRHIARRAGRTL